MIKIYLKKYVLEFKKPSGTSRGVLVNKESWFIVLEKEGKKGIGECGILRGLSVDDRPEYENTLHWVCENIHLGKEKLWESLLEYPSIQFGVEMAFLSLESENPFILFPSEFTKSNDDITINGLVWMGDEAFMKEQIKEKIASGFTCVKMKIGAINFDKEIALLASIRDDFTPEEIELRVDANGSFDSSDALFKLTQLFENKIHSIEQPIESGQPDTLSLLCKSSPVDIALDEELIGVYNYNDKENLLRKIKPKYIILKPSLVGGIRGCQEWIKIADSLRIGWWITSALESNVGLNAIAQWTFTLESDMPQGLGTGSLYTNNFDSPLEVSNGKLKYNNQIDWCIDGLL